MMRTKLPFYINTRVITVTPKHRLSSSHSLKINIFEYFRIHVYKMRAAHHRGSRGFKGYTNRPTYGNTSGGSNPHINQVSQIYNELMNYILDLYKKS